MFFTSSPGQYQRFFAKRPSGEITGGVVRHSAAYQKILSNLSSWNIYLGMNPANTWRGIKVRDDQINEAIGLVVDIDPVATPAWAPSSVSLLIDPALRAIESTLSRVPYSTVVATGRGIQIWIRVLPHTLHSNEDRFLWRSATRQFLLQASEAFGDGNGYKIDTSCSDISRLIRAPMSINQKTGTKVEVLETLELPPINPTSFLERFAAQEKFEPAAKPPHPSLKWWKSFHLLTVTAKRFIVEGVSEPGRHSAAYATAASLRDAGIAHNVAERLILHGAVRCTPPLNFNEALRACSNAYRAERPNFGSPSDHVASSPA